MAGTTTGSGRSGPLLATGTLETYTPLGAFGQPVYLAHVQLKAAVRQKLGRRFADFFATPDREPGTGRIRWLADVQGPCTRWTDLPPGQQVLHALSIEELRSGFARYADELRAMGTSQQAQAFVALLDTALRVPDDSHLFLVGDQPVVSFWGFSHGDGAAFDALSVAPRQPAPESAAAPAPAVVPAADGVRRGWRWWWWLLLGLLIVLLALLAAYLLGLFTRFPLPGLDGRLPAIVDSRPTPEMPPADKPAPLPDPVKADPAKPEPVKPDPTVPPAPDPLTPLLPDPGRTDLGVPTVPGGVIVPDGGTMVVPAVPGAEVRPDGVLKPVLPMLPVPDGAMPGRKTDPKTEGALIPPALTPPQPDKAAPGKTGPDGKPLPGKPDLGKPIPGKPDTPDGKAPPAPQHKPLLPPLPPLGQPVKPGTDLAVPPANGTGGAGDAAFMEGLWRSGRGLVDTVTGQPLEQYYRFGRDGQGEVVVRRQDGSECTAPAQAAMRNGVLSIDEQSNARCPDGTSIDRARTECRRLPDGRTVCTGTGASGSTYSIGIQKGQ